MGPRLFELHNWVFHISSYQANGSSGFLLNMLGGFAIRINASSFCYWIPQAFRVQF